MSKKLKIDKSLLKLLKELVGKAAGKDSEPIVDIITADKPVNEFKIAEKLGLTINQTRNILYKLSNHNIVSFVRKKDEKKGWYIYSWAMDAPKALTHFVDAKKKDIKNNEHLLHSRETKGFYVCPNGDIETNEENALNYNFKCPECGQLLQPAKFEQEISELKEKIAISNRDIQLINVELAKLNVVREKKEIRKLSKEKAKKKAARVKKAKLDKKAAAKLNPKKKKLAKAPKKKKAKPKKNKIK